MKVAVERKHTSKEVPHESRHVEGSCHGNFVELRTAFKARISELRSTTRLAMVAQLPLPSCEQASIALALNASAPAATVAAGSGAGIPGIELLL